MNIFVRAAMALALVIGATLLGLVASMTLGSYAPFVAALPVFFLALGQAAVISRATRLERAPDPRVVPALAVYLTLMPVACFNAGTISASEWDYLVLIPAMVVGVSVLTFAFGCVLMKLPRFANVLAWITTALALLAVLVPSLPDEYLGNTYKPTIEKLAALPPAAVLVVGGAPIVVRGVHYENRRTNFDNTDGGGKWCEVASWSDELGIEQATVVYACKTRTLRCDDARRWCVIEDPFYAAGYTYEGRSIHFMAEPSPRIGNSVIRGGAELLALAALYLLYRGRTSASRAALAGSALAAASVAIGFIVRILMS